MARSSDEKVGCRISRNKVERILGRKLRYRNQIHHIDGDDTNWSNNNLVVCEDQKYHLLLHKRAEALKICGHANWRKCQFCGKYDDPSNLYINPKGYSPYHRRCYNEYSNSPVKYAQRKMAV